MFVCNYSWLVLLHSFHTVQLTQLLTSHRFLDFMFVITLCQAFWATVCKTVRPMLSGHCLSVLSVTLVYCGQMVGWIKMPFSTEVGLDPGHILLDGDPARPKKGAQPLLFGPCLLWPNGWVDQDATWYRGKPQPRPWC